jgi:thioredoxin reductase (NADPH)
MLRSTRKAAPTIVATTKTALLQSAMSNGCTSSSTATTLPLYNNPLNHHHHGTNNNHHSRKVAIKRRRPWMSSETAATLFADSFSFPRSWKLTLLVFILMGATVCCWLKWCRISPPLSQRDKDPSLWSGHGHRHRNDMESSSPQIITASSPHLWKDGDTADYYYTLVVVGAGPAGLTAALFAARSGLDVLVLGSRTSGQLAQATMLDNYPGYFDPLTVTTSSADSDAVDATAHAPVNSGAAWLATTHAQAVQAGVHFAPPAWRVEQLLTGAEDTFAVVMQQHNATPSSSSVTVRADAVLVATGAESRRLGLEHEDALWGTHVHSCAICDGSAYRNKNRTVIVVGGGDAAVDAALLLHRQGVAKVIVVHRRTVFTASNQRNVQAMLEINDRIVVRTPWVVAQLLVETVELGLSSRQQRGSESARSTTRLRLIGVQVRHVTTNATETLPCQGLFVMIGSMPNTHLLPRELVHATTGLVRLARDYKAPTTSTSWWSGNFGRTTTIEPAAETATLRNGLFAAGEVTDGRYRQAITAAAAGAQAAIDAERWLRVSRSRSKSSSLAKKKHLEQETVKDSESVPFETRPAQPIGPPECDVTKLDCLSTLVSKYPVVVFRQADVLDLLTRTATTTTTPYALVATKNVYSVTLSSDDDVDTSRTLDALVTLSGNDDRTLPKVFVDGTSVGGTEQVRHLLQQAHGRLDELIPVAKKGHPAARESSESVGSPPVCDDYTKSDCLFDVVARYPVVVFSKTWCPYCKKALELLELEGVAVEPFRHVIDLTTFGAERMSLIQDTLEQLTGRRTVPNIFIGGEPIGGWDQTNALYQQGKLRAMLQQAYAYPNIESA